MNKEERLRVDEKRRELIGTHFGKWLIIDYAHYRDCEGREYLCRHIKTLKTQILGVDETLQLIEIHSSTAE